MLPDLRRVRRPRSASPPRPPRGINLGPYAARLGRRVARPASRARRRHARPDPSPGSTRSPRSTRLRRSPSTRRQHGRVLRHGASPPRARRHRLARAGRHCAARRVLDYRVASPPHLRLDARSTSPPRAARDRAGAATPGPFAADARRRPGLRGDRLRLRRRAPSTSTPSAAPARPSTSRASRCTTSVASTGSRSTPARRSSCTGRVTDARGRFTGDPLVLESRRPAASGHTRASSVLGRPRRPYARGRRTRHRDHRVPLAPPREPVRRRGLASDPSRVDRRRRRARRARAGRCGWPDK